EYPGQERNIVGALVQLLRAENQDVQNQYVRFKETGRPLSEAYMAYYGDVIAAVAGIKDCTAAPPMLDALTTGNNATRGLAQLGPCGLDVVSTRLQSQEPT